MSRSCVRSGGRERQANDAGISEHNFSSFSSSRFSGLDYPDDGNCPLPLVCTVAAVELM